MFYYYAAQNFVEVKQSVSLTIDDIVEDVIRVLKGA